MSLGRISSICRSRYGRHASDLGRLGRAVVGRPALEHVGDVDVAAARDAKRREHVVEQPPGLPHERLASRIFFRARRLADEQPLRVSYRPRRAPICCASGTGRTRCRRRRRPRSRSTPARAMRARRSRRTCLADTSLRCAPRVAGAALARRVGDDARRKRHVGAQAQFAAGCRRASPSRLSTRSARRMTSASSRGAVAARRDSRPRGARPARSPRARTARSPARSIRALRGTLLRAERCVHRPEIAASSSRPGRGGAHRARPTD